MDSDTHAMHQAHLEKLAAQPHTTVLTPTYDAIREPWKVARLRPVMEALVERVLSFDDTTCDFDVRKTCLDDPETLLFKKAHPKLYYLLTDRSAMCRPEARGIVRGFLEVRSRVERGLICEGPEADLQVQQLVMTALQARGTDGPQ